MCADHSATSSGDQFTSPRGFTRINSIVEKDADNNAIITLNSLAQILSMEIDYNLDSLEYLFTPRT